MSSIRPSLERSSSRHVPNLCDLPEEILWQIAQSLHSPPPTWLEKGQVPDLGALQAGSTPLKALSLVSHLWRRLVIPLLFKHVKLNLADLLSQEIEDGHSPVPQLKFPQTSRDISEFAIAHDLKECIASLTVCAEESSLSSSPSPFSPSVLAMWSDLLPLFNPERLTIIAPPPLLATLIGCRVSMGDGWAFQIQYQRLDFEENVTKRRPDEERDSPGTGQRNDLASMFGILWPFKFGTWNSLSYHGGSCLNAFGTYHYFDKRAPCILVDNPSFVHDLSFSVSNFSYMAVFPHYVHFARVVSRIAQLSSLRSLSIQLAPTTESTVLDNLELIGKGNLNLRDCWSEVERSYMRLIEVLLANGHPQQPLLSRFTSFDCRIASLYTELEAMLDVRGWIKRGQNSWISESKFKKFSGN